jgi:hypothetical protein
MPSSNRERISKMIAVPASHFSREGACYFAEASELRDVTDRVTVYDDATGYRRTFYLSETQHDAEGDVILWRFTPRDDAYEAVELFND